MTTLPIVIPALLELTYGIMDPIPLVLLIYISVNMHYLLPFHHVNIMIGAGRGYYSNNIILKYGLMATITVFIVIFGFYMPWWRIIKLI